MAQSFDFKPIQKAHQAAARETAAPHERNWRSLIFQLYLIAASVVFGVLALLARTIAYFSLDVAITRAFQAENFPWLRAVMYAVSWPGFMPQALIIGLAFVLLVYLFGYHWEAVSLLVTIAVIQWVNVLIKFAVNRPRPPQDLVDVYQVLDSYSFPSGHVMYYTALFGFLMFLAFTLLQRGLRRAVLVVLFAVMILLVGPSRIYLGQHWFSDVAAAYLLGSLGLAGAVKFYRWGKDRFFKNQPVGSESGNTNRKGGRPAASR